MPRQAPPPPPPGDGPLRLCLVARLEPRKAIDRALRALARVPHAWLEIVGDGPLRARLTALAGELGVAGRVHFWGYRPDPEAVIAGCDAVVCSSRTEGLPFGPLEAMALGPPAAARPVGGGPQVLADGENGSRAAPPPV